MLCITKKTLKGSLAVSSTTALLQGNIPTGPEPTFHASQMHSRCVLRTHLSCISDAFQMCSGHVPHAFWQKGVVVIKFAAALS